MNVAFLFDPVFLGHNTPAGHPESPCRLEAIVAYLSQTDLSNRLYHIAPAPAAREYLLAIHDSAYIDALSRSGEG